MLFFWSLYFVSVQHLTQLARVESIINKQNTIENTPNVYFVSRQNVSRALNSKNILLWFLCYNQIQTFLTTQTLCHYILWSSYNISGRGDAVQFQVIMIMRRQSGGLGVVIRVWQRETRRPWPQLSVYDGRLSVFFWSNKPHINRLKYGLFLLQNVRCPKDKGYLRDSICGLENGRPSNTFRHIVHTVWFEIWINQNQNVCFPPRVNNTHREKVLFHRQLVFVLVQVQRRPRPRIVYMFKQRHARYAQTQNTRCPVQMGWLSDVFSSLDLNRQFFALCPMTIDLWLRTQHHWPTLPFDCFLQRNSAANNYNYNQKQKYCRWQPTKNTRNQGLFNRRTHRAPCLESVPHI